MTDILDSMIKWEDGEMEEGEMIAFFQYLIDSGIVYSLRGCYGRMAAALENAGKVHGFL